METGRKVHGSRENIVIANYSERSLCFRFCFFYDSVLKILLYILTHLIFITLLLLAASIIPVLVAETGHRDVK